MISQSNYIAPKKRPAVLKKIKFSNSNSQYLNDQISSNFILHYSDFLSSQFPDIETNIECRLTLKHVRDVIRTYIQDKNI